MVEADNFALMKCGQGVELSLGQEVEPFLGLGAEHSLVQLVTRSYLLLRGMFRLWLIWDSQGNLVILLLSLFNVYG
jgi:hypothetical protein